MLSNQNHIEEEELIELLKNREHAAMEYLYQNYAQALFGVIFRLVNDREIAEEILQDTFLKIWNRFSLYDPARGRLFTWMLNIARNSSLDYMRTKHFQIKDKIQSLENNVSIIDDALQTKDRTEEIGIRAVIEKLNTKYMQVIDLLYFKGYSQTEASQELDIPLGTVKTRTRKALSILKNLI